MNNWKFFILFIGTVFMSTSCIVSKKKIYYTPDVSSYSVTTPEVIKHNDSLFTSGKNFLQKNKFGNWEIYVEGNAYQRGLVTGALMESLLEKQEQIFFDKMQDFIPNPKRQKRILSFQRWYNRNIIDYIPMELQVEIYGISKYASTKYNHIGPSFMRSLALHGAHDIGHALVDLAMVGCTSSALWGDETKDGNLLIGRNLDFYLNDEFAEEKVVWMINPEEGIPFISFTWPGFVGVLSGMNKEGLTITMNAGKSKIPFAAKTPISIVARDILQNASSLDEAITIAKSHEVFVSEALMIGSAKENKAILIEMSPKNFGIYEVNNSRLVCSNHFQSEEYSKDKRNEKAIQTSHTLYRFNRMNELLDSTAKIDYIEMAEILRNKEGLFDLEIGFGNEKALNQLVAHHAVIFQPVANKMWVSSSPYQLGAFASYDLNEIFKEGESPKPGVLNVEEYTIPEDQFIYHDDFKKYLEYLEIDTKINRLLKEKNQPINEELIAHYQALNPEMWSVYYKSGMLYWNAKRYDDAKTSFEKALQKEITTLQDCTEVERMLYRTNKKLN